MKSRIEGLKAMGGGTYEDSKGRTYIGDRKKERLYAVDRGSKGKLYLYQQRYTIPLLILLMTGFYYDWYMAAASALIAFLILEFLYRRFLNTLTVYENMEIPRNQSMKDRFEATKTSQLLLMVVLSFALAVLLVLNVLQTVKDWTTVYSDLNTVLLILVTAGMELYIVYFLFTGIGILLKRKKA